MSLFLVRLVVARLAYVTLLFGLGSLLSLRKEDIKTIGADR